ncbi:MAG: hypothetical protein FWD60_09505 [Candidatus Azobacteroides sp.]|nr:hypothetical protein [Candidatus Azobacteroides sp.]
MKKVLLENEIKKVVEEKKENGLDSSFIALERVNEEYEKLVNAGLATRRGYNLMTINDVSVSNYEVN